MFSQLLTILLHLLPGMLFLLSLHLLRRALGNNPLHFAMGVFLVFGLLSSLPTFLEEIDNTITFAPMAFGALTIPTYITLLIIYETQGTTEALRTILGLFLTLFCAEIFIELLFNTSSPSSLASFSIPFKWDALMEKLRMGIVIFTLSSFVAMFGMPVIHQLLRNIHVPLSLSLFINLIIVSLVKDYEHIILTKGAISTVLTSDWGIRLISSVFLTLLAWGYIRFIKAPIPEKRGAFSIFTGIFSHIMTTERLRRNMEEWSEQYQAVLDHSSELIFLANASGNIINANRAAYQALGPNLAKRPNLSQFVRFEDNSPFDLSANPVIGKLAKKIDDLPELFTKMSLETKPDTPPMDVDFNISKMSINGELTWLIIARDMTIQRNQERKQQEDNEKLMHAQRLESLGTLAGGVSHDFNNMLHAIQANLELLSIMTLPKDATVYLSSISDVTARASKLTEQLLGFARKGKVDEHDIDIAELAQQTATLFKTTAKGVLLKVLIEPEEMTVHGDPIQLQQVILNLLINAKDAVSANTANPKITLRVEKVRDNTPEWEKHAEANANAEHYICIKVKDNGCGISEETIRHIFDPFFTTKAIGKGTGMGLAMAYGCITHHRGWLHVESQINVGTEFTIVLPRASHELSADSGSANAADHLEHTTSNH